MWDEDLSDKDYDKVDDQYEHMKSLEWGWGAGSGAGAASYHRSTCSSIVPFL